MTTSECKEAAELIARLKRDREKGWPPLCSTDDIRLLLDHIETLEARVATLSAALEPFARACSKHFNEWCPDETPAWFVDDEDSEPGWEKPASVTVGDFRAAREATHATPNRSRQ